MTVEEILPNGRVRCVWYDHGARDYTRDEFDRDDLLVVDDGE